MEPIESVNSRRHEAPLIPMDPKQGETHWAFTLFAWVVILVLLGCSAVTIIGAAVLL